VKKPVQRLFAAVIVLLALGSCDILFNGVFPGAVAQATARADLSKTVDAAPAGSFQLSTVSSGGNEYVILFTPFTFDSSRTHLVIMDSQLKVLNSYTLDELTQLPPVGLFSGNWTMTECNNRVVIGNLLFDPSPAGFVFFQKQSGIFLNGPSVRGKPVFDYNETNFRISGGELLYDEYWIDWSPFGTKGAGRPLGVPSPPPPGGSYFELSNVFTDTDSASSPDVLVFQANGPTSLTYFLRVPKDIIDGDLGTAVLGSGLPDVFSYAAANLPPLVVKSNLERDSIGFSRAGIVAYDRDSRSLVRFTLDAPDTVSSLSIKWVNGMKAAAGLSGSYCVVWDPVTRTLTRYEQWW
jgi:hypothetical protein